VLGCVSHGHTTAQTQTHAHAHIHSHSHHDTHNRSFIYTHKAIIVRLHPATLQSDLYVDDIEAVVCVGVI